MTQPTKQIIEALLFASAEPLSAARLKGASGKDQNSVRAAIDELRAEYESQERAFMVQEVAGGFQLVTRPQYADAIERLNRQREQSRLSPAAMETLAIIAYKQPVGRAEIESIRGVQSGQLLRALMEKGLVRIAGRQETLGRPLLYGTSNRFLQTLGLSSIGELPKPEEMAAARETPQQKRDTGEPQSVPERT
jgi:segregation and condensation protein B